MFGENKALDLRGGAELTGRNAEQFGRSSTSYVEMYGIEFVAEGCETDGKAVHYTSLQSYWASS